MEQFTRIGLDTPKRFFQLHAVDAAKQVVLRCRLDRRAACRRLAMTGIG